MISLVTFVAETKDFLPLWLMAISLRDSLYMYKQGKVEIKQYSS